MGHEKAVLVVGPGKAFGLELCKQLVTFDRTVLTVARGPLTGEIAEFVDTHYQVDVTDKLAYARVLDGIVGNYQGLQSVVYNAVAKDPPDGRPSAEQVERGAMTSLAAWTTYRATHERLLGNDGQFILTGGNFAQAPDYNAHPVLSMQKVVTHALGQALMYESPIVGEYRIDGDAYGRRQEIAFELASWAVSKQLDIDDA